MEQLIELNLSLYGPLAVFTLLMLSGIGIALGEEMVTIPAGVGIATGEMGWLSTGLAAYLGIVFADLLWFSICRHYGTPLLHKRAFKRLVHPRRLLETKHQMEQRGVWLIVMSRFIPSSRTSAITVAGMFRMPFWHFAIATASCVLLTVPLQLGIGYLIGQGLDGEVSLIELLRRILGIVLVVVAVTVAISWWRRHRIGQRRPPRAKAAWLRRFRPRIPQRVRKRLADGSAPVDPATSTTSEPSSGEPSKPASKPPKLASSARP
jgi:membrane protein DedA with SNARE-associated domain